MKKEKSVYQRLKEVRVELGFTQIEVANASQISRSTVSKIENGEQEAYQDLLMFYVRTHNISSEWVLNGVGNLYNETAQSLSDEEKFNDDPYVQSLKKALALKDAQIKKIEADNEYLKLLLEGKSGGK